MGKLLEKIMKKRGFDEGFLTPEYGGFSELIDAKKAAERIARAAERGEKVLIYGDYDADGVTASTVMRDALELAGIRGIEVMLPDRFKDGYGMSERLVERAKEAKVDLVITVDCGSNNYEIIEKLTSAGAEVIVTDHHECMGKSPAELLTAFVNPKRPEAENENLKKLAGVGVAFMVAWEMMKMGVIPEGQEKWLLDLVLIGTICDSMVMTGVNRTLCFYGMKVLAKTRRPGLLELMRRAGVKQINAEAIGFQMGPRINAAGRMKSAELAFDLLNTKSRAEAAKLAEELEELNSARKAEQVKAAREISGRGIGDEKVLVETGEWHEGVLGIIAGNLVEDYKRPAFALAEVGGVMKGSGRSFGEFNLAEALKACFGVIIGGGGHAGACGVKLLPEKVGEFREKMNEYYDSLKLAGQEKFLETRADIELSEFSELTVAEAEELFKLEPYGEGNMEPVIKLAGAEVSGVRRMGSEGQHVKLSLRDKNGKIVSVVGFFVPEEWKKVECGQRVCVKIHLMINEWQGVKNVEGRILELK